MPSSVKKAFFADFAFNVWRDVYEPAEDSFLFADNFAVREGDSVLDIGTGCGILGIIAAAKATEVVAVDVNPHAVRCAVENARLNNVISRMFFVQADLFTSMTADRKFDLILFNAPYVPADSEEGTSWLGRAWAGGVTGRQVIDRFVSESPAHLKRKGQIFLMQSTLCGVDETVLKFKGYGLAAEVVAERDLPLFETIVLIRARRQARSR